MSKKSIALIGFMATGKTTIGKALVKYLGMDYKFIETDQEIIKKVGKSIPEIFSEEGELRFREYEILVCEKVSRLNNVVISCGGGVALSKKNIENLSKNCYIILLNANPNEIYKRSLKNGMETRPIINKKNLKKEIEKILKVRSPYYEASADIVINTTNKSIEEIVQEIVIKTGIKT